MELSVFSLPTRDLCACGRQKSRERRALMETTRAMQEHFNGASWDRKLGLTLAPPTYDHVVPGAPVPVKRKKKKYSV